MKKDILNSFRFEGERKLWSTISTVTLMAMMLGACVPGLVDAGSGSIGQEAIRIIANVGPVVDEKGDYVFRVNAKSQNPMNRVFPVRFLVNGDEEIGVLVQPGENGNSIFDSESLEISPSAHVATSLGLIAEDGYCSADQNPDPLEVEVACWFNSAR